MNKLVFSDSFDPRGNLAAEELLFSRQGEGMTLYLWQNANTVVVGRFQNAWRECRTSLLEEEGGILVRRTTGGGAVYHDLGNLNFTFICPKKDYDLSRQTSVIISAVRALGVEASFTGRNDIVAAGGAKFSGNAFRFTKTTAMQHGTLLVCADMEKLARYLAPSKEKLSAKGVKSVRARVCNLAELSPRVTIRALRDALAAAFFEEYGEFERGGLEGLPGDELRALTEKHASWEWRMGASPECALRLETRFSFGGIELMLDAQNGLVSRAFVFSDAMDEAFIGRIAPALEGAHFDARALASRISSLECENMAQKEEICLWLSAQSF